MQVEPNCSSLLFWELFIPKHILGSDFVLEFLWIPRISLEEEDDDEGFRNFSEKSGISLERNFSGLSEFSLDKEGYEGFRNFSEKSRISLNKEDNEGFKNFSGKKFLKISLDKEDDEGFRNFSGKSRISLERNFSGLLRISLDKDKGLR
ncbi:unnamed protein product [Camellia sinensis]